MREIGFEVRSASVAPLPALIDAPRRTTELITHPEAVVKVSAPTPSSAPAPTHAKGSRT
jgi:hypothetical protein